MLRYRAIVLSLLALLLAGSLFAFYIQKRQPTPSVRAGLLKQARLVRMPNSNARYLLCTEVFAYSPPSSDNPYKTDYTFRDPFRAAQDTVTPLFLGRSPDGHGASFQVRIELRTLATYTITISHIAENDGIALVLPDNQNHLKSETVPVFIVSSEGASLAVLDYTCPNQWEWHSIEINA